MYTNKCTSFVSCTPIHHKTNEPYQLIPSSLTHLAYGRLLNSPSLPSSLTHLYLRETFNEELDLHSLPHLSRLIFGGSFNQPLPFIPPSLRYLKFGNAFNQPLKLETSKLTHLTFGIYFNHKIDLPITLTHLIFGIRFSHPFNIPPHLIFLSFNMQFKSQISSIPPSLSYLLFSLESAAFQISEHISHLRVPNYKPDNLNLSSFSKLTHLSLITPIDNYPLNVTHLKLGKDLGLINVPAITSLPPTITHLICNFLYIKCTALPPNLIYLKAKGLQVASPLPTSLKYLWTTSLSSVVSHLNKLTHLLLMVPFAEFALLSHSLPQSITHLIITGRYNETIYNLPPSLTHIWFDKSFNQPLHFLSSSNLKYIRLGSDFMQSLDPLPDSLLFLDIVSCDKVLERIPKSLKYVVHAHPPQQFPQHIRFLNAKIAPSFLFFSADSFDQWEAANFCPQFEPYSRKYQIIFIF